MKEALLMATVLLGGCAPQYAVEAYPHGHGWVRCEYRRVLVDDEGQRHAGHGWDVYRKGETCPTYWTPN